MWSKYQYKDRDYVKAIIDNGFTSKYMSTELKLLAKYYKELGYNEEKIKEELHSFCKNSLNTYSRALHYKIVNNAVSHATNYKNKLIQINYITITDKELNYIDNLELPHTYRRIVFSLLVMNKLFEQYIVLKDGKIESKEHYFGGYQNYRQLVKTSKTAFGKKKNSEIKDIHDLIRLLDQMNVVRISNNGNIKLLFIDEIENGRPFIEIKDYESIGYYYDFYHGENKVKECENCSVPIKVKSNRQKHCTNCKLEKNKEKHKRYNEKRK